MPRGRTFATNAGDAAFHQRFGLGENVIAEGSGAEIEGDGHIRSMRNGLAEAAVGQQTVVSIVRCLGAGGPRLCETAAARARSD